MTAVLGAPFSYQSSFFLLPLPPLSLIESFQHFYRGISPVIVDVHIILPRNAAEGNDPIRADAFLQNFQHIGLAGVGGVDLQVGVAVVFLRRVQHDPHRSAKDFPNPPRNLLGVVCPGQSHDVEHLLPPFVIAVGLAGIVSVG